MNNIKAPTPKNDLYLEMMKEARNKPAVLKTRFATLRTALPRAAIFVFEGLDDKAVYAQWIRQVTPEVNYEPFLCGNKRRVLELKSVLDRDLSNLRNLVYFFVDRDFDDLACRELAPEIFLTERYSVENYLVEPEVLNAILREELHCHAAPEVRKKVVDIFVGDYEQFLTVTKEINFLLYCARRLGLDILNSLPEKISKIACVEVGKVTGINLEAENIIKLSSKPSEDDLAALRSEFDKLDPKFRYRGKFAYMFFMKWLHQLNSARTKDTCQVFSGAEEVTKTRYSDISIGLLATRSPKPEKLVDFLSKIKVDLAA